MLRITELQETRADGNSTRALKLEGSLQGEWVKELRRTWRSIRRAATGGSITVVLADVPFMDAAGKVLLSEMYRDGIEILGTDSLTTAMRDEIVNAVARRTEESELA